ncbi:class-II fumarase/aspartase family protein [Saccharopolyspora shandongensis]|uniref:class-II fumarase/aspartase family protein n=1 Tax=Saccharopolyspora shandongensis TaxID=418495 RepID=UPI0033F7B63B
MSPGLDAGLLSPVWAGTPVHAATSDGAWLAAMLRVEVALARVQARLGVIPDSAVEVIESVARPERFDLGELAVRAREAANPVVPLVSTLTSLVAAESPAAADHVHRGCTSQDVLDTASMLVTGRALAELESCLDRCTAAFAELAERHRDTPMAGRTLTQHAVPTTFGLKAAGWLAGVGEARRRVHRLRTEGLPVSIGGAGGTAAAYAAYAQAATGADLVGELVEGMADELGLAVQVVPWHTQRVPLADLGWALSVVAGVLGKFGVDVQVLCRTEVGEAIEPGPAGRGASSAMPQKRNPVLSTLIVAAARQVAPAAGVLAQCMLAEDERPAGAWHAEWQPLRDCLRAAGGAAHTAAELAEGLAVFPDRMLENLHRTGGAIVAERVNVALAPVLGKARAKQVLARMSAEAAAGRGTFDQLLADAPELRESDVDAEAVRELLAPQNYLGAASWFVKRALDEYAPTSG